VKFVVIQWQGDGALFHDPSAYLAELPRLHESLPPGAAAYASEPGHYDFSSTRCVKDLKFDGMTLGDNDGLVLEVRFAPNPWKHDEHLTIRYNRVTDVRIQADSGKPNWQLAGLRLDEVLPHEAGCSHEMAFVEGSMTVVAADLVAVWA
jgi:hypothetical protein